MDRRAFLRAGLGAAGTLVLASCGKSSSPEEPALPGPDEPVSRLAVRLPSGGDRGFPSPVAYSPGGYGPMIYIYDTLLWRDASQQLVPWLASSYQRSDDGLAYTVDLRDNVRWHDGQPLTADDVVFTFQFYEANRPQLPPFLLFTPQYLAPGGVTATGPLSVQFALDRAAVTFPEAVLGRIPIIPRHIWSTIAEPGSQQDPNVLVGSGPYRLTSYARAQGAYLFEANDDFFLGKPVVGRIEMKPAENELNALRAGEVDAGGPPGSGAPVRPEVLTPFRGNREFAVIEGPYEFPSALYWNLDKGGPLADVRFRRACALAIDRDDLVRRVLGGAGRPGNPGFLPPGHPFRVEVEQYPFDRGAANRLLDEAGYRRRGEVRYGPDGRPLRLKMLMVPVLASLADVLVSSLRMIGVEVKLDPVEFFQILVGNVDFEMALLFYGGVSEDPDNMRDIYSTKGTKSFRSARGYHDEEFDELADRQLVTLDETERRRLVGRMQHIVARDLPLLHLYYPRSFSVVRRSVFGQLTLKNYDHNNKQVFVTGRPGGTEVRPIRQGS